MKELPEVTKVKTASRSFARVGQFEGDGFEPLDGIVVHRRAQIGQAVFGRGVVGEAHGTARTDDDRIEAEHVGDLPPLRFRRDEDEGLQARGPGIGRRRHSGVTRRGEDDRPRAPLALERGLISQAAPLERTCRVLVLALEIEVFHAQFRVQSLIFLEARSPVRQAEPVFFSYLFRIKISILPDASLFPDEFVQ